MLWGIGNVFRRCVIALLLAAMVLAAAAPAVAGQREIENDPPVLYLRAPEKNSVWDRTATMPITWTYMGAVGPWVKLVLFQGRQPLLTIAGGVPSDDHAYRWRIPAELAPGGDYRIKIVSERWAYVWDFSHEFTIR